MQIQTSTSATRHHAQQPAVIHTRKRPTPDDIARAWAKAQSEPLPDLVSGLRSGNPGLFDRFSEVYPQLCERPRRARRHLQRTLGASLASIALMIALGHAPSAEAANIIVNENCAPVRGGGGGICTLIDAITSANVDSANGDCTGGSGADIITLSCPGPNTYNLTSAYDYFSGSTALPLIESVITIEGNGATIQRDPVRSGGAFRVFAVNATGDLTLNNTIVSGGSATADGSYSGGGIYVQSGALRLNDSTVSGNVAGEGGGIANRLGLVTLTRTVVSGNYGGFGGGIWNGGVTLVSDSTIRDNLGGGGGIGILNDYSGLLTITGSTISGNGESNTKFGGGISNFSGMVTLTNSTVSGNVSDGFGGGILNGRPSRGSAERGGASVTLTNSTVTGNTGYVGGGLANYGSTISVSSTIIAGNTASNCTDVFNNNFSSGGNNLIGLVTDPASGCTAIGFTDGVNGDQVGSPAAPIDPLLGPLQNNGGPTETHALLAGSLAIDAGSNPLALATDQRGTGFPRVSGTGPDVGAFELQILPADDDNDGVVNDDDLCPGTPTQALVDPNGCSDAQVDGDGDGVCDPDAPSGGPSACTGSDNCPVDSNPGQDDFDMDGIGDACDTGCFDNLFVRPKAETGGATVSLVWAPAPGATSYDILRSDDGPATGFAVIATGHTTNFATYLDKIQPPLSPQYWYKVAPNGTVVCLTSDAVRADLSMRPLP